MALHVAMLNLINKKWNRTLKSYTISAVILQRSARSEYGIAGERHTIFHIDNSPRITWRLDFFLSDATTCEMSLCEYSI